ncbi:hypothetical protein SLE2022_310650 [Rubroshorea leprosula]
MEAIGVLMTYPMNECLEQELEKRFNVACNSNIGADAQLIEALPKLEIVATCSVGLDKIDLIKCKEKGIRVTNTPDVLTDDVADLAIGLILAVLRRLCESDKYVRSGKWKKGDYKVTTSDKPGFLNNHKSSICAVACNADVGANAQLIGALPKPEILAACTVGLDKIDLIKCKEKGIRVTNTTDVRTDDVADIATLLMMSVLRRLCESNQFVRRGNWEKGNYKLTSKSTGKSVGIIELGRFSMTIAKRAEAFSHPVSYPSRTQKLEVNYKSYPSVVEFASNCQNLVVACSTLTEEIMAHHKPRSGAGRYAFEHEPEVRGKLFELENVVLLPHVGNGTDRTVETQKAMAGLVISNLEAHFLNKPLITPVI